MHPRFVQMMEQIGLRMFLEQYSHLKPLQLISWVVAMYLLTSAVTTPIYGKLADFFGRKIVFTVGTIH
jgi:MFS family permease